MAGGVPAIFTKRSSKVICERKIELDSKYTIFTKPKNCLMKKLKVSEVLINIRKWKESKYK
jgi:hypothetical protein